MLDFFRVVPKKRKVKYKKGKKGLLYHNPPTHKKLYFYFGTLVFLMGLSYFVYLYYPLAQVIFVYNNKTTQTKIEDIPKAKEIEDFVVYVPKIGASSEVKINIDPFDESIYLPILDQDLVAHAKDTSLPNKGLGHTTFLFAHSSRQGMSRVRNNTVFYLLNDVNNGDVVYIKAEDNVFIYEVYKKEVVEAKEVDKIYYTDPEKEVVMLQTCWPIGTDWKRLLVYAKRKI